MEKAQLNLRVDAELKSQFTKLCESEKATVTEAITEFMQACIDAGKLLDPVCIDQSSNSYTEDKLDLLERVIALEKKSFRPSPNPSRSTVMTSL
ncbi:MAG: hypothetical protein ACOVQ7_27715 [Limnoraphis robusta]